MNKYLVKIAREYEYWETTPEEEYLGKMYKRHASVGLANDILENKGYKPSFLENSIDERTANKISKAYMDTLKRPNSEKSTGLGILTGAGVGVAGGVLGSKLGLSPFTLATGIPSLAISSGILAHHLSYSNKKRSEDNLHQTNANKYLDTLLSKYEKVE